MTDYVVGFALDQDRVVMIRKNRPAWQAGLLNGVGGKIEPGETPIAAMVREFWEETSVQEPAWTHFCTMHGGEATIYCYYTRLALHVSELCRSITDEQVVVCPVSKVRQMRCLDNIPWLLDMAQMFETGKQTRATTSHLIIEFVLEPGVPQAGTPNHAEGS